MTTPTEIVIRLWEGYDQPSINALVNDWDGASFTIPLDHPMSGKLWSTAGIGIALTISATDELEWSVREVHRPDRHRLVIECEPRHDTLRRSLATDEYLISLGMVTR